MNEGLGLERRQSDLEFWDKRQERGQLNRSRVKHNDGDWKCRHVLLVGQILVNRDERMATDCLVVASFLIPDDGKEIWGRSARILMAAMIGFVLASEQFDGRRNLRSVVELTTTQADFQKVLKLLIKGEEETLPQWVIDGFNQFIAIEPETRNSALFNITTALGPWNNELIAAVTADTDFDIRNLRRERMTAIVPASLADTPPDGRHDLSGAGPRRYVAPHDPFVCLCARPHIGDRRHRVGAGPPRRP